jgi:hypothetical protein
MSPNERSSRIGSLARPEPAHRLFPPPETFRYKIASVRLAPVFLLVPAECKHRGPRRRVQLPIPLTPTGQALIVLLNRFRSADESGLQLTPNRANHDCLATIVAYVLGSVQ